MKTSRSILFVAAVIVATATASAAQAVFQTKPQGATVVSPPERQMTDDEVVRSVFDPLTDALHLTSDQKFRIATIAGLTAGITDPLFDQLDKLDGQISVAALSGTLNEASIKDISIRQAVIVSQITATLARARAGVYKVLTPEQRAMVLAQYRSTDQNLGAISNVGP